MSVYSLIELGCCADCDYDVTLCINCNKCAYEESGEESDEDTN